MKVWVFGAILGKGADFRIVLRGFFIARKSAFFFCSFLHSLTKVKISDVKRRVFLQKNCREKIDRRGKDRRQKWRISASPKLNKLKIF